MCVCAGVVGVYQCGMCVPVWYVCASVVCVYRCGTCVPVWYVCAGVVGVCRCGMCVPVWYVCAGVVCVCWVVCHAGYIMRDIFMDMKFKVSCRVSGGSEVK